MLKMPEIKGLKLAGKIYDHKEVQRYEVLPEANAETFQIFLNWLPLKIEFSFWDQYYPSVSDPGGYVSLFKIKNHFIHSVGNHGWSWNAYQLQSNNLICEWLCLNQANHESWKTGGGAYLDVDFSRMPPAPWG